MCCAAPAGVPRTRLVLESRWILTFPRKAPEVLPRVLHCMERQTIQVEDDAFAEQLRGGLVGGRRE